MIRNISASPSEGTNSKLAMDDATPARRDLPSLDPSLANQRLPYSRYGVGTRVPPRPNDAYAANMTSAYFDALIAIRLALSRQTAALGLDAPVIGNNFVQLLARQSVQAIEMIQRDCEIIARALTLLHQQGIPPRALTSLYHQRLTAKKLSEGLDIARDIEIAIAWCTIDGAFDKALFRSLTGMQAGRGIPAEADFRQLMQWCSDQEGKLNHTLLHSISGMQNGRGMLTESDFSRLKQLCVDTSNQWNYSLLRSLTSMQAGRGMLAERDFVQLKAWCSTPEDGWNYRLLASITSMQNGRGMLSQQDFARIGAWCLSPDGQWDYQLLASLAGTQNGRGMLLDQDVARLRTWCVDAHDHWDYALLCAISTMHNGRGIPSEKDFVDLKTRFFEADSQWNYTALQAFAAARHARGINALPAPKWQPPVPDLNKWRHSMEVGSASPHTFHVVNTSSTDNPATTKHVSLAAGGQQDPAQSSEACLVSQHHDKAPQACIAADTIADTMAQPFASAVDAIRRALARQAAIQGDDIPVIGDNFVRLLTGPSKAAARIIEHKCDAIATALMLLHWHGVSPRAFSGMYHHYFTSKRLAAFSGRLTVIQDIERLIAWCTIDGVFDKVLFRSITSMQSGHGMLAKQDFTRLMQWCRGMDGRVDHILLRSITGMQNRRAMMAEQDFTTLKAWCAHDSGQWDYKLLGSITSMQSGRGMLPEAHFTQLTQWCGRSDGTFDYRLLSSLTSMQNARGMLAEQDFMRLRTLCAGPDGQWDHRLLRSLTNMQSGRGMLAETDYLRLKQWCATSDNGWDYRLLASLARTLTAPTA